MSQRMAKGGEEIKPLIFYGKNNCRQSHCRMGVTTEEGIRPANIWDTAITSIFQMTSFLRGVPIQGGPAIRVVVDAYFSKAPFLNPMIRKGVGVISHLRNDAVDWDDPIYSGKGRPPKHGKKWKLADLLSEFVPKPAEVGLGCFSP